MIKIDHIKRIVCAHYGITKEQLEGRGTRQELSQPRHMAMWLARRYTKKSYTNIGRLMNRHRNATETGVKKMTALIENNPHWKNERDALITEIEHEVRRIEASQKGTQKTA